MTEVSEYEAKRLRRIEENRKKLQSLNLPTIEAPSPPKSERKKRKREVEEKPLEPTRKSSRQRKKRKLERQQRKAEKQQRKTEQQERKKEDKIEQKKREKLEKKELKRLKKQKKLEKILKKQLKAVNTQDTQPSEEKLKQLENDQQQEPSPRILDWRLRRKLQAREERRKASLKRREERKVLREKEKKKKLRLKVRERKLRKIQMEKEKLERLVAKELALQRRIEEGEMMRAEDRLSKLWAKQQAREARKEKLQERRAIRDKLLIEKEKKKLAVQKEKDDALDVEKYPVRQINLPFVRISNAKEAKPLVLTPELKVDPNNFHMFSLGKQFLPPGKTAVMQGLCPAGSAAKFRDDVDIHLWKNAMTLFVNGTTGMFYHYMFEEATLRGRRHVFFRWSRCQHVTPPFFSRLTKVQKGEELLRFADNYYTTTPTTGKPEPLQLFIQYPNGPYIYCGRLGYLGYRTNPLEFSFQLLDNKALNWPQIRTLITSC